MSKLVEVRQQNGRRYAIGMSRCLMRAGMGLLCALVMIVSGVSSAYALPDITTTLTESNGYGRMVLRWPATIPHHTEAITAGVLVVKFDKPFAVDLKEFARQMPNVVALARQDSDRMTLRIGLKYDYWLNVQQAENALYLDLLSPDWSGPPPPLPADVVARLKAKAEMAAKTAAEEKAAKENGIVDPTAPVPDLNVRVARHDGITRLVFDWNQPVLYSLAQHDGAATITFDRTAKVALAQIRVNPPPFLKSISALERNGRLSVFMKLDSGVVVSDFREDLGIVLDIKPHRDAAEDDDAAKTDPQEVTALPPETSDAAPMEKKAATVDHAPKSITPVVDPASDEPAKMAEQPATPQTEAPTPSLTIDEDKTPILLKLTGAHTDNRSEIVFPWPAPTGAAVFQRANTLWVVFDRHASFDMTALDLPTLKGFGEPVVVNLDGASALAIPVTEPDMLIGAEETGTQWHIIVARSLASTGRSIALTRNWSASGEGYVSADIVGTRKIIKFVDPQVHDTLMLATARGLSQSMQASLSFIEFQALKTVQGLAISPLADDLNVAAAPDAIIISRPNGLALSADNNGGNSSADHAESASSPAMMDFAAWRGKDDFLPAKQALMMRAAMAAPADEAAARLDYGRFLLGYGLAPEALVQFSMASKADLHLDNDPGFTALRGVAEVMAHRNAPAVADLSASALELDPYAAGWRGLAQVELGQMDKANKDFDFAGALIDTLDPALSQEMQLAATKAALAMKDVSSAQIHLGKLPADLVTRKLQARSLVLRAQLLEALKKPQAAVNFYDRAIEVGDREGLVQARLDKALLLNEMGKLSNDKVIAELNQLRMMWRGDNLELRILTKLAEKDLAAGKVVDALEVMRIATHRFPRSDEAQVLGAKMPEIFADYFMGPGSKELTGVQALSVYFEFQDLTPIGQRGDELIRNLAERLVSIDLLAQAEVLLKYQVEQRLYGSVAKAQVAARLATVYLLDNKPKEALEALRSTMQNQLPQDLRDKRQLIEARALASLKQYELALDLLSEIDGPKADDLRAEIYWESQNWDAAGQATEAIAEAASAGHADNLALSDDVRFNVMRSAIAYSLGGNDKGLMRLRAKFGTRMASSVDASAFAVVSDPIETTGVAFRQLAGRVASINMIERFVNSLKEDPISATVPEPSKAAEAASLKGVAVN